jgi:hypothetical protein
MVIGLDDEDLSIPQTCCATLGKSFALSGLHSPIVTPDKENKSFCPRLAWLGSSGKRLKVNSTSFPVRVKFTSSSQANWLLI